MCDVNKEKNRKERYTSIWVSKQCEMLELWSDKKSLNIYKALSKDDFKALGNAVRDVMDLNSNVKWLCFFCVIKNRAFNYLGTRVPKLWSGIFDIAGTWFRIKEMVSNINREESF